jgi:hypothetical protein
MNSIAVFRLYQAIKEQCLHREYEWLDELANDDLAF